LNSLAPAFEGKKILVTGHTGFKGVWFSRMLVKLGAEVHGLSLAPLSGSLADLIPDFGISSNSELDIRNRLNIERYFENRKFDGIFHLAAQPLVRFSYQFPLETFETNVMGTANILDAVTRHIASPWVVAITTDKVYANVEKIEGYKEDEPLGGRDPYSASKSAAEMAIRAWQEMNHPGVTKIVAARAGNVIGGGDNAEDRLFPDLIRSFRANRKIVLRNPDSIRPWQHVLDPLAGYLRLGEALACGKKVSPAYNFGPNDFSKLSVFEMAKLACDFWGEGIRIEKQENPSGPHESKLLWLNSERAESELGWTNKLSVRDSIQWTLEWEKLSATSGPLLALDSQISAFFGLE
jgi:CDP-glucose 4,6-dehydratase